MTDRFCGYDVSPDGTRVVVARRVPGTGISTAYEVLTNWSDVLQARHSP